MMGATRTKRGIIVAGLAMAAAFRLAGQGNASTARAAPDPLIIRGIEITTHRIFDSAEATSGVYKAMNSLHSTTRPYVIQQQLLFKVGERWDTALVRETARNLRTLGLFRVVTIDSIATDSGLIARVNTQDAWTFGIVFTIKSSGSQIGYAIGFNDRNVLGSGTQFQMQYGKNPDRDSVMFGLSREFLFGSPYDFAINFNNLSDGQTGWANFGLPFRTLESKWGWTLGSQLYNGRILLFVGGDTTAQDTVRRSFQLLSINPAIALHANSEGYLRLGLYAQIERNDFQQYSLPPSEIPTAITAAFGPFVSFSHPSYTHVRYYQAGGRREDLQLGFTGIFGVGFAPRQWGYSQTGLSPTLLATFYQHAGKVIVEESLTVTSLYSHSGLDSGTVYGSVTAFWQPSETQLLIGYVGGGAQKNGYPGENWDLGFGYAVRAYPQHSFTGNRVYMMDAEYRWFFAPNVFRLIAVGAGAFVDHAGAWYSGSPESSGTDAGIGLRFSSITGNPGYVMRADLAYRWATDVLPAGWVFTFGKGFVWQVF
jgi:hypothetical protein